jgi:hypothetical protein
MITFSNGDRGLILAEAPRSDNTPPIFFPALSGLAMNQRLL